MSDLEIESSLTSVNEQLEEIVAKVEQVKLSSENEKSDRVRFGQVEAVIESSGIATVTPQETEKFLHLGTAVYIQKSVPGLDREKDQYLLIGHIEDIFGPVKSPMYAVKLLTAECGESIACGDLVYYISSARFFTLNNIHPS